MAILAGIKAVIDLAITCWALWHGQWKVGLLFSGYFIADYGALLFL